MRPNKEAIEFDNSVENAVKKYLNNKQAYCMYPGCNMHAISSHTISKKISLNQISENGILFSPESKRMYPEKKYGIGEIGINDASTFKGFCKIHDEIFFSVDKNGIKSQKDVFLQVYRVLNYIIFNENVINKMAPLFYEKLNTSLKNENIKKIIERGKNTATEANEIRIKKLNKYSSNILNIINAGGLNSATFDEEAFLTLDITMDQDIQENSHNKNEDNLIIVHRKVNYHIPVAMATKVSFSLNTQGKEDELFLICIPYENYSDLIIMFAKGKSLFAKNNHYLHYIYNDLNMLELIEKTMVNSEDWWMSPRAYKSIPENKKEIFIEDMYYRNLNFFEFYDLSIFNDLRAKLIKKYKQNQSGIDKLIKIHEQRLDHIPLRDNKELKKEKLNSKMMLAFLDFRKE